MRRKKDWVAKGKRLIWHPFTQMKEWEDRDPTIIVTGNGTTLTDLEGNRYLDGVSSIWVNVHGHRNKTIDQALIRQIRKISHTTLLGLSNLPAIELAEKLIKIAPKGDPPSGRLVKVFYSDDGSTAVEAAVKIAFGYWRNQGKPYRKKKKFIAFDNAYHGDTIGSVSLGGIDLFHHAYRSLLFETIRVPSPTCYRCPLSLTYPSCKTACIDEVEKAMKRHAGKVAGLVIEPLVQAAAGMLTAPPNYLKRIRTLCTRYKILMIADEVATGFGRTGRMFACEHEGISPDIMAISKGLTGGYLPLGATLATQAIYDAFLGEYSEFKTFFHGHSYTGNPLGCAAAIANLEIFEKEKVLDRLQRKIHFLKNQLGPWKRWRHVGEIRQVGFMVGIELVADKKGKTPYPLEMRIGRQVCQAAKSNGVLLRPLGNVIVLMPPLSISMRDLKRLVAVVGNSIRTVTSGIR
ncbi:MAG: adenosylmethionine--8-amino-7-oxononanoate transaminase [Nitrospiria bacterium]